MIRNLNALALALMASFALGGVWASGASASVSIFHSAATTSNTISTGTSENNQVFTRGVLTEACTHAELEGTNPTWSQSTLEVAINYTTSTCTGPLNTQVHIDFTSGNCRIHLTGTASKTAQVKLACEAGGSVTTTATNSDGSSLCTIHIPPQTFGGHVIFTSIKHNNINSTTAESTLTNISSTRTGSALCGPENSATGTLGGSVTITGYEDAEGQEGKQVAVEVT